MYEVIVLGATFAAADIAHKYKEKCLVIERQVRAGYEFFGALHFGSDFSRAVSSEAAHRLQANFLGKHTGVYGCDSYIYPFFKECFTVFGAEVISTKKTDAGFLCVTHGVAGFCTYKAKRIIDTRCNAEMSKVKTYNLLIESKCDPAFSGVSWEHAAGENRYILRCPVPLDCEYMEARSMAMNTVQSFSETQRLILSADEFDYQVKDGYPKTEGNIFYLPSKAYENPLLAFDAGVSVGEEAAK